MLGKPGRGRKAARVAALGVAAGVLVSVPGLAATFQPGRYSGRGKELTISFTTDKTSAKSFHWNFSTFRPACSTGQGLRDNDAQARSVHVKIGPARIRSGKFSLKPTYHVGSVRVVWQFAGALSGKKASGTYRSVATHPGYRCDTGTVRWTAKRG